MRATMAGKPASATERASVVTPSTCVLRSSGEYPRSAEIVRRRASPSSTFGKWPRRRNSSSRAFASVVLPEQGRPVSQITKPLFIALHRPFFGSQPRDFGIVFDGILVRVQILFFEGAQDPAPGKA